MWDTPMANFSTDYWQWYPDAPFSHKAGSFHDFGPSFTTTTTPDFSVPPSSSHIFSDPCPLLQELPTMIAEKKLHWTQRVALIRHNLHASSRTGDFTFFKTLQAHRLLEGTDHLAALTAVIGDAADQVLASLDNYNSVMAYVHEDAFKNVHESVKAGVRDQAGSPDDRRAIYHVDAAQQKEKAEKAIDKMINSAITIIAAQPATCQDEAANVWIWGTTFVADAMEVCLAQIDAIEACLDDFIRLEHSWSVVQSAVGASIGAIKGIFNLMAPGEAPEAQVQHRTEATEGTVRSMLRRMSTAMTSGMASGGAGPPSRRPSVLLPGSASFPPPGSVMQTGGPPPVRGMGGGMGGGVGSGWRSSALKHSKVDTLPTIPPTPAAVMLNTNPFENLLSSDPNFSISEDMPPPPTAPITSSTQPSSGTLVPRSYSPATVGSVSTGTITTTANNGSDTSPKATRPRSSNVVEPRPMFDDMLFMQQDDPLAEQDEDARMAAYGGSGGFLRRLSEAFAPAADVHRRFGGKVWDGEAGE